MINAILFDLDGTLLNTLEDLMDAANFAITKFGYEKTDLQSVRKNIGNGILNLLKRTINFDDTHIDEIHNLFKLYYKDNCNNHTYPYDGIVDVLEYIKSKGIHMAVITNKAYFAAKTLIDSHFQGYFDMVLGDQMDLGLKRKPDPSMIEYYLNKYNIDKENVIYIGDSNVDIETIRNAKINGAIVSYGFRDEEELLKLTDKTYKNTNELLEYIKSVTC
ncbi:MAG: HAD-IA family hydrolase [Acholeplasmatales bacterium]|nr:HAD-IA family hydrolase [Acholeplasmatales bacterium]